VPRPLRSSILGQAAAALLVLLDAAACTPKDGRGTLARVRGDTIRVGVSENRPWTTLPTGGGAGGIEGALVAELARDLDAKIEWVRAPESQLLEALALHELDLVIGGLTDAMPWKGRVAITRPIYTDTVVVAALPGTPLVRRLDGRIVAVRTADRVTAAFLRALGGVPRPMPDLSYAPGLVAAPTWLLPSLGMAPAGITVREARHVLATPPGEDAWKAYVERSLAKRMGIMGEVLRTTRP
jgi:polar amino acid transport system substrate-binding protein